MYRAGSGRAGGEGGQAVLLIVAALALVSVLCLAVVKLGVAAAGRARAVAAADAAALAGAADGRAAAEQVTRANGGVLVSYRVVGDDVIASVQVGGWEAQARARAVVDMGAAGCCERSRRARSDTGAHHGIPYTSARAVGLFWPRTVGAARGSGGATS